jgi:hypothetical protein
VTDVEEGQYQLDMGRVVVRAGGRANIHVQPHEAFRPARLSVLPEVERGLVVDEVWVGETCLWRGPLPAEEIVGEGVSLTYSRTVSKSTFVTVAVSNASGSDVVFRAVVSGPLTP